MLLRRLVQIRVEAVGRLLHLLVCWVLVVDGSDSLTLVLLGVIAGAACIILDVVVLASLGSLLDSSAAGKAEENAASKEDDAKDDSDDQTYGGCGAALGFSATDAVDGALVGALVGWDHSVG